MQSQDIRLAFGQAAEYFEKAIALSSGDGVEVAALRRSQAKNLADSGQSYAAAQAFSLAAELVRGSEASELRSLAGTQYLISGHVDEGLASLKEASESIGIPFFDWDMSKFLSVIVNRSWRTLFGFRGKLNAAQLAASVPNWKTELARRLAFAFSVIDPVRSFDFLTRTILRSNKNGDTKTLLLCLFYEACMTSSHSRRAHLAQEGVFSDWKRELGDSLNAYG